MHCGACVQGEGIPFSLAKKSCRLQTTSIVTSNEQDFEQLYIDRTMDNGHFILVLHLNCTSRVLLIARREHEPSDDFEVKTEKVRIPALNSSNFLHVS